MASGPLDAGRWKRLDALVAGALELAGEEREAFLAHGCEGDLELRAEVDALLSADDIEGFLDPGSSPLAAVDFEDPAHDPWIDRRLGSFLLRARIGQGGMGTVYEAWQEKPGRTVAVKILRERLVRGEDLRRFEYEAHVLGRLRHPVIAHLYDSGLIEHPRFPGRELPYFAMELVPGARPITVYAREKRLSLEDRIRLFLKVCDGVEHAHQRGILHRDLKPSNLLVDESGEPRIIDFGIARPLEHGPRTRTSHGALLGTLQYMSPQQCQAAPGEVDLRSDVYTLGLVLYELVTDERPYDVSNTSIPGAIRVICEEPPRRPSRRNPACRGDLEVVMLAALAKEPTDRYASCSALAADLRRVLDREPIVARPPGRMHRLRLFARRNPLGATASLAALLAVTVGGGVSGLLAVREGRAHRDAERRELIANEVNAFLTQDLLGALDPYRNPDPEIRVRDVLDAAALRIGGRFHSEPLVEAGVRRSIGLAYLALGLPNAAVPQLEPALALLAPELGESSAEVARAHLDLARALNAAGALEDTEREVQRALDGDGAADPGLRGHGLAILGSVARARGDHEQALRLFTEARELLAQDPDGDELDVLTLDSNVAEARHHLGDLAGAEREGSEVLEKSRAAFGAEHPRTLESRANLALVRKDLGRTDEAREMLASIVEISLRTQGPDAPTTLNARANLGVVDLELGLAEEAAEQAEAAYSGYGRSLGPEQRKTLHAALTLGRALLATGNVEEGESMLRENREIARSALGERDELTLEVALHLARALASRGDRDGAIRLLRTTTAGLDVANAPPEQTLALLNQLGTSLMDAGLLSEAEPNLARASAGMRELYGVHPGTAVTLRSLGRCLLALEKYDEAEAALVEAHDIATQLFGADHGLTRQVRGMIVKLLEDAGRADEAATWRTDP